MIDTIKAWQCIGCGSIEARETCIGVCEYRKAEFVAAAEHQRLAADLEATRSELGAFRRLVARLARVTPRAGAFESSYRALQQQAQTLLQDAAPQRPGACGTGGTHSPSRMGTTQH